MTGSIGERSYVAIPWAGDYAYGGSVLIQSVNVSAQGGGSGKVGTSAVPLVLVVRLVQYLRHQHLVDMVIGYP